MRRSQARGGIERKFLTSILWVGVIPMALALIIGYAFAREGQQIAVQQNLATAARKTAEGLQLALRGRMRMVERVAQEPDLVEALRTHAASGSLSHEVVKRRLQSEADRAGELGSVYALYDREGNGLLSTGPWEPGDDRHPEWVRRYQETAVLDYLRYFPRAGRYATRVLSPVRAESGGEILGYLSEVQGIEDWVTFVRGAQEDGASQERVQYEVVYLTDDERFVVHIDDMAGAAVKPPQYGLVDRPLANRLREESGLDHNSFMQWKYTTRGENLAVLLAYHRLFPDQPFYIVAFRRSADVFLMINLAAALTIVVTSLVIALFCVIAYRIVNNNIIRPVSLLNEGAQIIRQGDFELKLVIETGDEIEELAQSFNKMAMTLRQNITRLEASEEKYRNLITSMRDGIYQSDPEGRMTFMNAAGVEILGFGAAEEVLETSFPELFVEEIDFARVLNELDRNQFVERTRVWMKRQGGQPICVELTANRIFHESGETAGIEGNFRDVTQNMRLEQEARERSERIAAINQIANAINSSLEAGRVYESIVVEMRKLVSFDYAAVTLRVEDSEDFETRALWPEHPGMEPLRAGANRCAAWVVKEARYLAIENLHETDLPFANEFPGEIQSCVSMPLYAGGRIIGTLNLGALSAGAFTRHELETLQQMTPHVAVAIRNAALLDNLQQSLEEVTRAREKLHDANEELKTLDEMKTNLLSNVSHELRTPLVAVMGYTDMILNGKVGPINEMQEEYLGISLRNIEKLVTLIENLLDFSRLHRGAEEMVFDTFDLVHCAQTSLQIVQPIADNRKVALVLREPGGEVLVEGDKGKMGQVFNNLLSNAVKFNDPGGTVTIEIRPGDATVDVYVVDTGIGIPPEAQDKIFTRFYQYDASSTRKYGGTGIGLAIAQDIMRLHGSRIDVTSELGKGATFHFNLPLSLPEEAGLDMGLPLKPLPTETHLLIELVTQDRALSTQIRNELISEGMDVIHAAYPAAALYLANKYSPDCMLVDTEAGPLGSVVVEEILDAPESDMVPIILLTNDDALYERYRDRVASRVKRGFRKSALLSGIHYALSKGMPTGEQLGNRVLCVDDDPEIVMFITRCLQAEGYAVDTANNGEQAYAMAKSGDYWLVLLDVAMPGMDGWEACTAIKNEPSLAGIRAYLVTAKPVDKTPARVYDSGADGYLLKPFKAEDLVSLVQSAHWRRRPAAADEPGCATEGTET
jgi:PAS domain S-box-containing protein